MDSIQASWPSAGTDGALVAEAPAREAAPRRVLGAVGFLADAIRRRRSGRITLWTLVVALAGGGLWLLAYPFVTDLWASRIQDGLRDEFAQLEARGDPNATGYESAPAVGSALTRLRIPSLGVSVIVVEGVTGNALRAGAGHFPGTALPGAITGNIAIAGHRTGYGEPFRHLDQVDRGDQIFLDTPFGKFLYRVEPPSCCPGQRNPFVVKPTDLWVITPSSAEPILTLVTCDPPHTSKNRLIVRARFVREVT